MRKKLSGKKQRLYKAIAKQLTDKFGTLGIMREQIMQMQSDKQLYCKFTTCLDWVQKGNLLFFYYDVYDLYQECGYKVENYSETEIWIMYCVAVAEVMFYNLNEKNYKSNIIEG